MDSLERTAQDVARRLVGARRVLFITGAGVSAESGLPTYRGIGGLYEQETTEEGIPIEHALSGAMLRRDPALCWKYIAQVEAACRGAEPNGAHRVMSRFHEVGVETVVLTQNVDALHRRAGTKNLIEIHGDVHDLVCTACSHAWRVRDYSDLPIPPACPQCGGLVRPRVVLFGEFLDPADVRLLTRELERGFDAVFSVGTTSVFPYIAQPVLDAARSGRLSVEVNPGDTEVSSRVDFRIRHGAGEALGAIFRALGGVV